MKTLPSSPRSEKMEWKRHSPKNPTETEPEKMSFSTKRAHLKCAAIQKTRTEILTYTLQSTRSPPHFSLKFRNPPLPLLPPHTRPHLHLRLHHPHPPHPHLHPDRPRHPVYPDIR